MSEHTEIWAQAQAEGTSGQGLEEPFQDRRDPGGEVARERKARGWVEVKEINGHGPYAYLHWREGRVKRSRYLGQVKGGLRGQ